MALLSVLQYSRNVSQTRWIIDDERMEEASVEVRPNATATVVIILCEGLTMKWLQANSLVLILQEIIGSNILIIFHGDNYKFHATGREDIVVLRTCFPWHKF